MQAIPAAYALGTQWAQNPNINAGSSWDHSTLSNMDPLGNAITQIGGDPLNLYGNKNNPNALLFPSSNPNANTGSAVFPNLGAASMVPQTPGGAFQQIHNGAGQFNAMAAQGAGGRTFNPAAQMPPANPSAPNPQAAGGLGGLMSSPQAQQGMQGGMMSTPQGGSPKPSQGASTMPYSGMSSMMVRNNQDKVQH